ncbi:MAG: aminotransferase class I/II-fold pyridoxal phosphate-dependent enzyme [Candidatus Magasanikbacteria bacterium]|nr:aminotransferase class I/II-fold pyridoxal phosphate-dependent enzyme [Candidatus Magasanikbacteria bacterium]
MKEKTLLNRNEVIQGPSPKVLKTLKDFPSDHAALYFEGYFGSALIPKLSKIFQLPEEQIIIGYGLEDIFRTIFYSIRPENDIVLTHEFHYTYYDKYLNFKNIRLENFRLIEKQNEFAFYIDDCLGKIGELRPKVVLITSPNNPTGNSINLADFEKILNKADKTTLVVLDEAYFGFDENYNQQNFIALLEKYDNLMILRSFSKLYALAGLRIGFALCGKKVKEILCYQNFYLGGSRLLEEVAISALESDDYYENLSAEIIADRRYFTSEVSKLENFEVYDSKANFVLVKVKKEVKGSLEQELDKMDFSISKFVSEDFMRVSIGSRQHTKKFSEILAKIG